MTVSSDKSLQHAAHLMTEHSTAHLLVTDPSSTRLIGMLSTLDIATALVRAAA